MAVNRWSDQSSISAAIVRVRCERVRAQANIRGREVSIAPELCVAASRLAELLRASMGNLNQPTVIHMYIGSGILGTILIIALIVYLLRRA